MNSLNFKTLWALMRREFWESPVAFKWAPISIAVIIVFVSLAGLAIGSQLDHNLQSLFDGIRVFSESSKDRLSLVVTGGLFSVAALFFQIMLFIIFFYLASSLYSDRKDRSILFWKSLPVSDGLTVTSKLLTAGLLVPFTYFASIMLTHLALLLIATVLSLVAGVNPFTTFWLPASLPHLWTVTALGMIVQALWLAPLYAWFIFCSSWAPRTPLLFAIGIPGAFSLLQHVWSLFTSFSFPKLNLIWIMIERILTGVLPGNIDIDIDGDGFNDMDFGPELYMSFGNLLDRLINPEMWIGFAIAGLFLYASIWFRRRATDN